MDTKNRKSMSSHSSVSFHRPLEPSLAPRIQHEFGSKLRSLFCQLVRLLVPLISRMSPHVYHFHLPTQALVLPEPTKNQTPDVCVAHPLATCRPPPLLFPSRQPAVQAEYRSPCPLVCTVADALASKVAVRENPHMRSA